MIRYLVAVVALLVWAQPAAAQQTLKFVNLYNNGTSEADSTTTTTYQAPDYAPYYLFTAADWNPAPTVYFEAVLAMTAGADVAYAELQNITDSVQVTSSELSTTNATATRLRSGALTLTTGKQYRVRTKAGTGATARIYAARLIFVQSGAIVATETVYDFGGDDTTTSTSYVDGSTSPHYHHLTAFLDGTVATYFEAFIGINNAASTVSVQLHDGTSAVASSEVTATGTTTDSRVRSAAVSLTNGVTHKIQLKASANTARMRGARIIILQTNTPTKTTTFYPLRVGRTTATNTGATRTPKMLWDADEWSVEDYDIYFEVYALTATSDTCQTVLYNGTTNVDTRSITATTITRSISSPLSLTDNDVFDLTMSNSDGSTATFRGQYLRLDAALTEGAVATGGSAILMRGVGDEPK